MEKETLLTELKKLLGEPGANGQLGDTGITMRTLDKYAEAILPTIKDDKEADEAFYKAHAAVAKALGGQMRYEQAEFVRNYKQKATEPKVGENVVEKETEWEKRLKAMEEKIAGREKELFIERLRSGVIGKSEDLKVSNRNLWEDAVKAVSYADGMKEEDMEKAAKAIYEARLKRYSGDGAVPYGGTGTSAGQQDGKKNLDSFFARKAAEGKFPQSKQE